MMIGCCEIVKLNLIARLTENALQKESFIKLQFCTKKKGEKRKKLHKISW